MNAMLLSVVAGLALVGATVGLISSRRRAGTRLEALWGILGSLLFGFPVLRFSLAHLMDGSGSPALVSGPLAVVVPLLASVVGALLAIVVARKSSGTPGAAR